MVWAKRIKDIKAREIYHQNELLKTAKKFVFTLNANKALYEKDYDKYSKVLMHHYQQPAINDSRVKIVHRCILSNRARGTIRKFGVSRITLKAMLDEGLIPGWTKGCW